MKLQEKGHVDAQSAHNGVTLLQRESGTPALGFYREATRSGSQGRLDE